MDPSLQKLVDERSIIDLVGRYCWAIDNLDRPALERVFLPDATAVLGSGELQGRDAIWTRIHGVLSRLDTSQHVLGSHVVEVDGDTARSRCYFVAQHVRQSAEGGPHYVVAGSYQDDVVRTPDGWRIKHRLLTTIWTEGNPRVFAD
ncbi:MAG: hypothetical protein RL219_1835 [Actinomycetota bacterium]|jgi:hypothetical protein